MLSLFRGLLTPHTYQRLVVEDGLPREEVLRTLTKFYFKGIAPDAQPDAHMPHRCAEPAHDAPSAQKGANPA